MKALVCAAACAVALASLPAFAEEEELPLSLQATLLMRILSYDHALEGNTSPAVLVVYADKAAERAEEVMHAFSGAGMNVSSVKVGSVGTKIAGSAAAYVVGSGTAALLKELCVVNHVLSVAGDGSLAVDGLVAVALGVSSTRKPEIIVNLPVEKSEGHQISASVLRLARVIQ